MGCIPYKIRQMIIFVRPSLLQRWLVPLRLSPLAAEHQSASWLAVRGDHSVGGDQHVAEPGEIPDLRKPSAEKCDALAAFAKSELSGARQNSVTSRVVSVNMRTRRTVLSAFRCSY